MATLAATVVGNNLGSKILCGNNLDINALAGTRNGERNFDLGVDSDLANSREVELD